MKDKAFDKNKWQKEILTIKAELKFLNHSLVKHNAPSKVVSQFNAFVRALDKFYRGKDREYQREYEGRQGNGKRAKTNRSRVS